MLYRAAVLAAALTAHPTAGLVQAPTLGRHGIVAPHRSFLRLAADIGTSTAGECGCEDVLDGAVKGVTMNGVSVTGSTLRSMVLSNAAGTPTAASSLIGEEGKAVVVFLRHLG